ncbi:MAG: hypothetical protein WBM53_15455, partial [Maribacter sp.]
TQRMYRGFKRDNDVLGEVRKQFLENKTNMFAIIEAHKDYFENPREYQGCVAYIEDFFDVLANDAKFQREILNKTRTK